MRWVRAEGLHVTLKFLGDVPAAKVGEIAAVAAEVVRGVAPFALRVRGVGGFPSLSRPRALWVGSDAAELGAIAAALDGALATLGFAAAAKPLRAHVTLGRVRSQRGWPELRSALAPLVESGFGAARVERVVLYRSHLQPGGSVYEVLASMPLAGGRSKEGELDGH